MAKNAPESAPEVAESATSTQDQYADHSAMISATEHDNYQRAHGDAAPAPVTTDSTGE